MTTRDSTFALERQAESKVRGVGEGVGLSLDGVHAGEANVPTLYSSVALLSSSMLLAFIALAHKRNGSSSLPWVGLALVFLFLSVDEIASIHEKLGGPVRELLGTSGLLYFAWFIPYGIALLVFVAIYSTG